MSPPGAQPAGVTGAEDRRDSAVARSPRPGSPPRLPRPPLGGPCTLDHPGRGQGPCTPALFQGNLAQLGHCTGEGGAKVRRSGVGGWGEGPTQQQWGLSRSPGSGQEVGADEQGPSCPNLGVPGVAVTCPLSGRTSCPSAGSPHLPLHSALPQASTPSGPPAQNASAHPGPVTPAPEGGPVLPTPSPQRCPGAGGLETHTGPWMSRAATDAGSGSAGTRAWGLRGRKRCRLPPGR